MSELGVLESDWRPNNSSVVYVTAKSFYYVSRDPCGLRVRLYTKMYSCKTIGVHVYILYFTIQFKIKPL